MKRALRIFQTSADHLDATGYGRLSAAAVSAQAEQLAPRGSRGPRGGGRGGGRGSRLGGAPPVPVVAAAAVASEADALGVSRGDEDWTPADEGGVIDAGKKLGRCAPL